MRLIALVTLAALLFLSAHITVDHALVDYCHRAHAHPDGASDSACPHTHSDDHHPSHHHESGDEHQGHCHDWHPSFAHAAFHKLILPVSMALSPVETPRVAATGVGFAFSITEWDPPPKEGLFITLHSLLI
ncbi:MAG: hypothetical protein GHCLOJNM_01847 [bacterium]|nr:hypothetical protein [bacterium]